MADSIVIEEGKFKDLQIAILQQEIAVTKAQQMVAQAKAAVSEAFLAAGLDPAAMYQLDIAARTAIVVAK